MPARLLCTPELEREELALKTATRIGAPLPETSSALREYWHSKSLHRTPDASDKKQILEMFVGNTKPDVVGEIGAALELHEYRVVEVIGKAGSRQQDPRN
jgi:hypothetical protein